MRGRCTRTHTRTRTSNMGASNYARPYWIIHPRGRQRLSCFFLLFCYALDERELPPPSSPSPTTRFLSFLFFLLFSLLLPIFSSRLQSSQEEIRPLGSRNILENIFDFSREPLSRDFSAKKFLFVVESFLFSLSFFLSKKFSSKGEKRFPCTLSRENNRFREAAYLEFLPRI